VEPKRYWSIVGYRSTQEIYKREIPVGWLPDSRIGPLLMALAARAGLDLDEIPGGYVRRGSKMAHHLLELRVDKYSISCGHNPWFTATVVTR
jgi:hypothetical protein